MLFGSKPEHEIQQEAKTVARNTTDDPTMQKYIEGAAFKIIKLEEKVDRLTTNFWVLVFILFVLPLLLPRG